MRRIVKLIAITAIPVLALVVGTWQSRSVLVGSSIPSRIAFMSDRDGDVEIYTVDADGGSIVRLTHSADFDGYPAWAPDGTKIAFMSVRDGDPEIFVMNAGGGEARNLTNDPGQDAVQGDFSWSPDGTQILYHSDRDGDLEVYVMDADGSNQMNLTNNVGVDFGSTWVP